MYVYQVCVLCMVLVTFYSNELVLKYRRRSDPLPNADDFVIEMRMKDNFGIFVVFTLAIAIALLAFLPEVAYYAKTQTWAKKTDVIRQSH